jgi:hypothetical protein
LQTVFSIKREAENSENKLKIPYTVFCNLEYFGIVDKVVKKRGKKFSTINAQTDQQEKYIYHLPA